MSKIGAWVIHQEETGMVEPNTITEDIKKWEDMTEDEQYEFSKLEEEKAYKHMQEIRNRLISELEDRDKALIDCIKHLRELSDSMQETIDFLNNKGE